MTMIDTYLWIGVVIWVMITLIWITSLIKKDASIIDPCWSLFFLASCVTGMYLSEAELVGRKALLLGLVALWSLRLFGYLTWRCWGEEEDFRYKRWREKNGSVWWWRSYLTVFYLQGLLAWIICIPLVAIWFTQDTPLGILDWIGVAVWAQGFFFESAGDWQLARFKGNPENKGKVLNTGVWRYTRHPNYYGDAAQWWGFYLVLLAGGAWWTIYAPLLMTLLLIKVSGVALLEKSLTKTKPKYADYIKRTPSFVPWFPKSSDS